MVYACNKKCSIFCLFMSIWGTIQLLLMGLFCNLNSVAFVEFLPLKENYNSLQEFRDDADRIYWEVALRCYVTAILYGFFAVISLVCIRLKKKQIDRKKGLHIHTKEQV
ncbi:hypothetical protein KR222_003021 [Zaprionus bogoriensis]|nr:hypothetical protein KR222_003021 [Zaprionus bogoriensis]